MDFKAIRAAAAARKCKPERKHAEKEQNLVGCMDPARFSLQWRRTWPWQGDIDDFVLPGNFNSAWIVSDFVSLDEEKNLVDFMDLDPVCSWVQLKNRRLKEFKTPLPQPLQGLCNELERSKLFPETYPSLNHVLVNEYLPGQGIMAHKDGPMYSPHVIILSLGR